MAQRARASTKSKEKASKNPEDQPGQKRRAPNVPARAHRGDTGEARQQRDRTPKTHPTRNVPARRKDK